MENLASTSVTLSLTNKPRFQHNIEIFGDATELNFVYLPTYGHWDIFFYCLNSIPMKNHEFRTKTLDS